MKIDVTRVPAQQVVPLRELHRQEMGCQIVHDSLHERGLTHPYLLNLNGRVVGYGTVFGLGTDPKETVDELFVVRECRGSVLPLFRAFVAASGAKRIQAQTNDPLLTLMLFDCASRIVRDRILFEDGFTSTLSAPGLTFRRSTEDDEQRTLDGKRLSEAGEWILENGHVIVGAGGVLLHYNPPYGDLYMEVAEAQRRKGYGSFLIQELKRVCYEMGKVPTARCDVANVASRAALQKAGMLPCGSILIGEIEMAGMERWGEVSA
jgi:GNAT superfamily N-acetyltransferase